MYNLIKSSKEELNTAITNTAARKGMNTAIVEKDLWVCITLDYLFHHSKWKDQLAFKGGTCLSKVYHLIERFSEDVDLILDWRVLGYGSNELWEDRSKTKQLKLIEESKSRLFAFLKEEFLPEFKNGLSQMLGINCDVFINEDDLGTVIFAYQHSFKDNSILSVIRLEISPLASWIPLSKATIQSFISEEYPNIVSSSEVELLATTPERTFWEKATILHQEAFRPENSLVPKRYSRHYYDIYCMCKNDVKETALKDSKLLEDVASFKEKFYPRGWARYDLAKFGTLRLMPAEHSLNRLRKDYADMKSMIYGEYPSFDEILKVIKELEKEVNNSK